jgi:hypothetical protein
LRAGYGSSASIAARGRSGSAAGAQLGRRVGLGIEAHEVGGGSGRRLLQVRGGDDLVEEAGGVVALTQGLAAAETSRRLGTSKASVDRRWTAAIDALLDGFAP